MARGDRGCGEQRVPPGRPATDLQHPPGRYLPPGSLTWCPHLVITTPRSFTWSSLLLGASPSALTWSSLLPGALTLSSLLLGASPGALTWSSLLLGALTWSSLLLGALTWCPHLVITPGYLSKSSVTCPLVLFGVTYSA